MEFKEGQTFTNWSQSIVSKPQRTYTPRTIGEVVDIVRAARAAKKKVRACGSGWSFSDIMVTNDYLIDTDKLAGVARYSQGRHAWTRGVVVGVPPGTAGFGTIEILPRGLRDEVVASDRRFVWVGAGTTIRALYEALDNTSGNVGTAGAPGRERWALPSMGGASGQTLAGALSTGTHGGSFDRPPIADMVRAIHLVGPDGELYWIEGAGDRAITDRRKMVGGLTGVPAANLKYDDDWFDALLVSLGAMGVICSYVIEVVDQYGISERRHDTTWNRVKRFLETGEIFTTTKWNADARPWIEDHPPSGSRRPLGLGMFINPYRKSYDPRSPDFHDRNVMLMTHAWSTQVDDKHVRPPGPCDVVQAFNQAGMIAHFEHTNDPAGLGKILDQLMSTLRASDGTRGYPVNYSVLDTTSSDARPPVLSMEIVVSTVGGRHVRFVDHLLQIFDDTMDELRRKHGAARFAGAFNLRFTRPTRALLGMQYPTARHADERFCHIEVIVLREQWMTGRPAWGEGSDYTKNEMENFTEVWWDRFERATTQFGARLHWGQLSRTGQHDPHRYPEFDKWLAVRATLTDNGTNRTFDNGFVARNIPTWERLPGTGRDIAIGGAAPLVAHGFPGIPDLRHLQSAANAIEYVIGTDTPVAGNGGVWKHDGTRWHTVAGMHGTRIAADPQGQYWVVQADGDIFGPGGRKPGRARDIAVGADGTVCAIGADEPAPGNGSILRWDGTTWRALGGYGTRIAVDPRGQPWIVNSRTEIWGPGGRKPGRARDIGIGADGTVWVIGTDTPAPGNGGVYRWTRDRWRRVEGHGVAIAVAPDGKPWVVRANGEIWRLVY